MAALKAPSCKNQKRFTRLILSGMIAFYYIAVCVSFEKTSVKLDQSNTDTLMQSFQENARLFESKEMLSNKYTVQQRIPSRFAYAYVIGGCNPENPTYRYYIYNILVSTKILRERGSRSDVVVLFQMAWTSNAIRLPDEDVRVLEAMNIHISYIPKTPNENFYRTNLDKFRILNLTEYERILFLDGDVMPQDSLDYLFELSVKGVFRENVVMQGVAEPANGGFFMLKPNSDDLVLANQIMQKREKEAKSIMHPFFDPVKGWGHEIRKPDIWKGIRMSGENWTFHAAFADQGFLYYWVKYVKASVTICRKKDGMVEHILRDETGELKSEVVKNPMPPFVPKFDMGAKGHRRFPPDSDYIHFTGRYKPWLIVENTANKTEETVYMFWNRQLRELFRSLDIQLNLTISSRENRPSLGMFPVQEHVQTSNVNLLEPTYY